VTPEKVQRLTGYAAPRKWEIAGTSYGAPERACRRGIVLERPSDVSIRNGDVKPVAKTRNDPNKALYKSLKEMRRVLGLEIEDAGSDCCS